MLKLFDGRMGRRVLKWRSVWSAGKCCRNIVPVFLKIPAVFVNIYYVSRPFDALRVAVPVTNQPFGAKIR